MSDSAVERTCGKHGTHVQTRVTTFFDNFFSDATHACWCHILHDDCCAVPCSIFFKVRGTRFDLGEAQAFQCDRNKLSGNAYAGLVLNDVPQVVTCDKGVVANGLLNTRNHV